MSDKPFDGTTQKTLGLVAIGLATVLVYAAASEAGWIKNTDPPEKIELPIRPGGQ